MIHSKEQIKKLAEELTEYVNTIELVTAYLLYSEETVNMEEVANFAVKKLSPETIKVLNYVLRDF